MALEKRKVISDWYILIAVWSFILLSVWFFSMPEDEFEIFINSFIAPTANPFLVDITA